jgi:hypothetical protein
LKFRTAHALLILILLLAFALRVYAIDAQPLRGDEAFAIRYWAQPPAVVLETLAWIEPHPYGTFLGFWAWKSLVGDTELAMRLLPTLLNLLGVAGIHALALRLRMGRAAALLAALLWAVNPNLIWHSQDARNYAAWAGMSVCALWLLLRALERNRRVDWLLYVLIEALTLYVFFLEAFLLVVHLLIAVRYEVSGIRRVQSAECKVQNTTGSALCTLHSTPKTHHSPLITHYSLLLILILPWLYQVYRLAGSGYGGTASGADVGILLRDFAPELLFGERLSAFGAALPGEFVTLWVLAAALLWWLATRARAEDIHACGDDEQQQCRNDEQQQREQCRPRYIIAITPALILLLARVAQSASIDLTPHKPQLRANRTPLRARRGDGGEVNVDTQAPRVPSVHKHPSTDAIHGVHRFHPTARVLAGVLLLVTLLVGYDALETYYAGGAPKAPDWRALGSYLEWDTDDADAVVLIGAGDTAAVDPAFMYYYRGAFEVLPQPDADTEATAAAWLAAHETVYLIHAGSDPMGVEAAFDASAQAIGGQALRGFRVMLYPGGLANPMQPLDLAIGGGRLTGWRVVAVPRQGDTIWLLLGWDVLPDAPWKTFVHLRNADGIVVVQADHYPTQPQDVYALSLMRVPAGTYTLHVGIYNEATGERALIADADGAAAGDSALLTTIDVAPHD